MKTIPLMRLTRGDLTEHSLSRLLNGEVSLYITLLRTGFALFTLTLSGRFSFCGTFLQSALANEPA